MNQYCIDALMRKTFINLVEDFRTNLCDGSFAEDHLSQLMLSDLTSFRQLKLELTEDLDPYTYKCRHQINNLFKRYIFQNDRYTRSELEFMTLEKFKANQDRLRFYPNVRFPKKLWDVVKEARKFIIYVLGDYSLEEHLSLCSFGSRATVGVPLSRASEAQRWEPPITGSKDHISWFCDNVIAGDYYVSSYLRSRIQGSFKDTLFQEIDHLDPSLVPKKFDSLRFICPNTTIGNYYTKGIGVMMERRLKRRARHDISRLQRIHGKLAKRGSISGRLVTCDQANASDNIIAWLVSLLLPDSWVKPLEFGRIGLLHLPDGSEVDMMTFAPMGIGYTFPLQTLIFLGLLKGLDRVFCHRRSTISVYGDDLIYTDKLHPHVLRWFPDLGLQLNVDKTHSTGRFRESCGSDYYQGVDVRPFSPKTEESPLVPRMNYEAVLYKTINGLLRRWSHEEIPRTLLTLIQEIETKHTVLRVPFDYPDESGIKCFSRSDYAEYISKPSKLSQNRNGVTTFRYLGIQPHIRKELRHEPFLWKALRHNKVVDRNYGLHYISNRRELHYIRSLIDSNCNVTLSRSSLISRVIIGLPSIRSRVTGRRFKRTATHVAGFATRVRFKRRTGRTSVLVS